MKLAKKYSCAVEPGSFDNEERLLRALCLDVHVCLYGIVCMYLHMHVCNPRLLHSKKDSEMSTLT